MNRATKEPEPRRGPNAGAKTFASFGAFAKGSRCKSETASRNTRSNGYAPPSTQSMVGPEAAKTTQNRNVSLLGNKAQKPSP